jgi:transcriptional regulator with XRE-family HTH domain
MVNNIYHIPMPNVNTSHTRPPTDTFGQRLRAERQRKGFSTRHLARRAGVTHAYISGIEHGKFPAPNADKIMDLATALGVDADPLIILATQEKRPEELRAFWRSIGKDLAERPMPSKVAVKRQRRVLRDALQLIGEEIREGLKHGDFEYVVTCRPMPNGDRELVLMAGRVHRFTITAAEIRKR